MSGILISHPSGYNKSIGVYSLYDILNFRETNEMQYIIDDDFKFDINFKNSSIKIDYKSLKDLCNIWETIDPALKDICSSDKLNILLPPNKWKGVLIFKRNEDLYESIINAFNKAKLSHLNNPKISSQIYSNKCYTFFDNLENQASINLHLKNNSNFNFIKLSEDFYKIIDFVNKL